jgi:hypothetical protein
MSLFAHRTSTAQGIGARSHQRRKNDARRNDTLDRFAEALSEHGDLSRAAAAVGKSAAYGRVLFARIRKQLGEQAR